MLAINIKHTSFLQEMHIIATLSNFQLSLTFAGVAIVTISHFYPSLTSAGVDVVTIGHFYPSLILTTKAVAYPSGAPYRTPLLG